MATYKVTVALDNSTISALSNGFQLQVFKGVKSSSPQGALPTVWTTIDHFAGTVEISWSDNYGGYFSNTMIAQGARVSIATEQNMNPGEVITLSQNGSSSVAATGGIQGAFAFMSEQTNTWTSGLTASANGSNPTSICAFSLYGSTTNILESYERVVILFTQELMEPGTIVRTAVSSSLSITLSAASPTLAVIFNINTGWDTLGSPYAQLNPSNFELAPGLIVPIS
ncbi:MAG: hypothetical protein ACI837_001733 [Crocinitomicaceae bacterium]|jgi:hypothetical protein